MNQFLIKFGWLAIWGETDQMSAANPRQTLYCFFLSLIRFYVIYIVSTAVCELKIMREIAFDDRKVIRDTSIE